MLDIAFPGEGIYIEYDGGGHNLQVLLGNVTKEDFQKREIMRYYFLKSRGWKQIHIISTKDLLPYDDVIFNIAQFAKNYINSGHSWIEFDIDKSHIKTSQYEKFF